MDRTAVVRQLAETQQKRPIAREVFLKGLLAYARPSFHPNDSDTDELAQRVLAKYED